MKKLDFNSGWTCRPLGREGEALAVTLPHDAMRTEPRTPDAPGGGNLGWFAGGDYEYRKTFTLPNALRDKRLMLEFEGVYRNAEVWLNGQKAAFRPYGYTNFCVDLNPWLREGENELTVIARNADQPNSRWYSGSGIYRPVWLWVGERQHIAVNGIRVTTLSIDPPTVRVEVKTSVPGEVSVEIRDGEMVIASAVGAGPFDLSLPGAALWWPDSPQLYTAHARFGGDAAQARFGIRTLTWDGEKGIALNGVRTVLRGACIHHDNGVLGACTYPEAERRRVRILKEAGYNAIRSAHNPCAKYLLDACDELGMLVMDEYADCWYMHKTQHDYASYVTDWWRQDLRDMVDKDYNHPSVILYSTGNEVAESAQARGVALQRDFTEYLHALDGTRPVTCGVNIFFNFLSAVGLGVYSDEKAAQAAPDGGKPAKKKAVGSEFFNTVAARIGTDFMKWGATLPPCDRKTRDVFAAMDVAGYNYGNRRYKRDAARYPHRLILGSETLIGDAYDFWDTAKTTPRLVGDFVWAGWDYMGECGEGSPEFESYVTSAPEDHIRGGTCPIDITGRPGAAADYTRVAFELEKGPRIAVYPPNEKKPAMTGWQLTRARRSWTWPGCEGMTAAIEVFARADAVQLFVNGVRVGEKAPKKGVARFKTVYRPGELVAVAFDGSGREMGRDVLRTAGETTALRLICESETARPGEMVYLRACYTDEAGEIKPLEKHTVRFTAKNGTVMGAINGSCYFQGNLAQTAAPTYFGEVQAVVQAGAPGTLRLTAEDGQRTATVEIPIED